MIVGLGKIHTLTRDTHTDTRCLGRRLHLEQLSLGRRLHLEQLGLGRRHPYIIVGIIGISRVFQTFTVVLQAFLYLKFIYIFHTYSS